MMKKKLVVFPRADPTVVVHGPFSVLITVVLPPSVITNLNDN